MLAILYRVARNTPILVAANREELFSRPSQYPKIQPGTPRVVCGIDRQGGGTWLGVNQFGLLIAVTNRPKGLIPLEPRSRGLLCRDLLDLRTARDAVEFAEKELGTSRYAGANYLCADGKFAAVVHGGNRVEVVELEPGLHTLSNGNVDDLADWRHEFIRRMLTLHTLDSAVTFLAVASRAFSRKPDKEGRRGIVQTGAEFGTVSSTLISLPRKIQHSILQHCEGPPSEHPYEDLSALLRQVLSAARSRKAAAAADGQRKDGDGAKARPKEPVSNHSGGLPRSRKSDSPEGVEAGSKTPREVGNGE